MRSLISLFLLCICFSSYGKATDKPIVILLSIDGFSFEYLKKIKPPNISKLANSGIIAPLKPVYPTKTFPNHLSIITGSYPVNHGITNNSFYNHDLNKKYFKGAGKLNSRWLSAMPFWSFAQQQNLKSAVYFWPESEILGQEPTYNVPFNRVDSNSARLNKIIEWLKLPVAERPQFIASYFSSVDSAGHLYGPNSENLISAVTELDTLIGEFLQEVNNEINVPVNIIIVSDHGMVLKDRTKIIKPSMIFDKEVLQLIENKTVIVAENDTQLYIYIDKSNTNNTERDDLIDKISKSNSFNSTKTQFKLYVRGNYPQHWHLNSESTAVPDMIFEAISPATFVKENHDIDKSNYGTHGYDIHGNKELMGIFIAKGPNIIKGKKLATFENIHVFPFMANLLQLENSQSIDGNEEVLSQFIIKE